MSSYDNCYVYSQCEMRESIFTPAETQQSRSQIQLSRKCNINLSIAPLSAKKGFPQELFFPLANRAKRTMNRAVEAKAKSRREEGKKRQRVMKI